MGRDHGWSNHEEYLKYHRDYQKKYRLKKAGDKAAAEAARLDRMRQRAAEFAGSLTPEVAAVLRDFVNSDRSDFGRGSFAAVFDELIDR